jgi:2-methylisocitrate lyase-like PEP mutase family enzyme
MTIPVSARFRSLLESGELIVAPGAYDALTARIIERTGFSAVYLGANALGIGRSKAQPFVTLTETRDSVASVSRAVDLPIIVDAGAGFGDPAHVFQAVRELEAAGAAALHIDDQPYPKQPRYHVGQGQVLPVDVVVEKLIVALQARRSEDFMIIARTDSLRVTHSIDETIARAQAFAAVGVDGLLVLDLTPEQAPVVKMALPDIPLGWMGGVTTPIASVREIAAAGFSLALYPFNTVAAVAAAVADLWKGLKVTGEIGQPDELLARMRPELLEIVHMRKFVDIEQAAGQSTERIHPHA